MKNVLKDLYDTMGAPACCLLVFALLSLTPAACSSVFKGIEERHDRRRFETCAEARVLSIDECQRVYIKGAPK